MTRRQWIDFVKEHVGKIDPTRDYHKNMISISLGVAYDNFVYDTYRKFPYELDVMGKEYSVGVFYDNIRKRYYSNLPCNMVTINKVGSGIIEINSNEGFGYNFVPMYLHEIRLISDLEVEIMTDEIGYAIIDGKVVYSSLMTLEIANEGVTMTVIPQFTEYGLDENIPIPAGQSERFLESVLNVLAVKNEEVLLNNNTNIKYGNRVGQSDKSK